MLTIVPIGQLVAELLGQLDPTTVDPADSDRGHGPRMLLLLIDRGLREAIQLYCLRICSYAANTKVTFTLALL